MVYYTVSNKNYFYKNYKNGNKKRISKEEYYKKVGGNNNNQDNGLTDNKLQAKNLNRQINVSKTDIETWLEIENILCRDYANRKFLLPNNNNKCLKLNNCSTNNNCDLYYSKSKEKYSCVNKKRISKFEGSKNKPLILKGKNNETYILLDTILYENDQNEYYHKYYKIYCHIFEKNINDINYLLLGFNCGVKVNLKIYENPEFIVYLNDLYNIILNEYLNYDKFIICGHSMGANTAIQLVLYLIQNNSILFNDKCKCIVSGMSDILNERQQILLNNNSNILLFMNGFQMEKYFIIDYYYNIYLRENYYENNKIYYPFIYLYTYYDGENNEFETELFSFKKINEKSELKFKTIKRVDEIHQWYSYYTNIKEFLKLL